MGMSVHFGQSRKRDDEIDDFFSSLNIYITDVDIGKARFRKIPRYEVMVDYQIIFIQKGCFVVEIGNKLYNIKEGEIVVVPPFYIKSIYSMDNTENDYTYFHFDLKSFFMNETFKNVILDNDDFVINSNIPSEVVEFFNKIGYECSKNEFGSKSIVNLLSKEILIYLLRRKAIETNGINIKFSSSNYEYSLLKKASAYIEENLCDNITVENVANHLQVSLSTLYKIFINTTNISPKNYIQILKAKTAMLMLSDKKNKAVDISAALGFNSYQAFNKFFKKQFTFSLTEYRKNFMNY